MAADDDRDWGETAEHLDVRGHDADLFVRLAQCGLFDRFLRVIEPTTGERHLTRMMPKAGAAYCERHMPLIVVRIDQEQGCRRSQC